MFKLPTLFGLILVLAGTAIVLKQVLHVELPLVRVAFGVLFVWTGLSLLSQSFGRPIPAPLAWDDHTLLLSHGEVDADADRELNVIFANGTIDLRTVPASNPPRAVEVNTVFGNTTVLYDASVPLHVDASSAFGVVELPNHETVAFGDRQWNSSGYEGGRPGLAVKASSVFGACRFVAAGEAQDTAGSSAPAR
jgi:predicted membrane protein